MALEKDPRNLRTFHGNEDEWVNLNPSKAKERRRGGRKVGTVK